MRKNSLRLAIILGLALLFFGKPSTGLAVSFTDYFGYAGGHNGSDYDCAGDWSSTTMETWISPGDGWSYNRGDNVRVAGKFRFYTYSNVACIQNHAFRYSYDLKLDDTILRSNLIYPGSGVITVPVGGGLWYHEFTLDQTVQIPTGTSVGSHDIKYVLRHLYSGPSGEIQVRAGIASASINVNSPPGPTPTPQPSSNPTPTPPPSGSITLDGNSDCPDGVNAKVHLWWSASTNDNQFNINKDGTGISSTYGFSWDSGSETQGQWHNWSVYGLSSGKTSNTKSILTATCSGPNPTPSPPPGAVDIQVVSITLDTPGPYYQGQSVAYHFVLRNNGSSSTPDYFIIQGFKHHASKPLCGDNMWDSPPDGDAGTYGTSLAAGEQQTMYGGFPAPSQNGTFKLGVFADAQCVISETNENNNYLTSNYTVSGVPPTPSPSPTPTPPTNPSNLQASVSCVSGSSQVSFTWTASTGANGYYLDVTTGEWASDGSGPPWAYKQVTPGTANSFTWNLASPLTNGPPTTPADNTQYWWRLVAYNVAGQSAHVYPQNDLSPPGANNPVLTPNCGPDLNFNDAASELQFYDSSYTTVKYPANYSPLDPMYVQVKIKNTGNIATPAAFKIGFYLTGSSPVCNAPPDNPPGAKTVPAGLAVGGVYTWQFNVPAPSTAGIARAFADYDCQMPETDEANNIISRSYNIEVNAWFETSGGDVGSGGDISVGQSSASLSRYQSQYLAATGSTLTNINTQPQPSALNGWRITNYSGHRLVAGSTYDYLAERFLEKAKLNPQSHASGYCTIPSGVSGGLVYCDVDARFQSGGGAPSGNSVWFINGNLTIKNDMILSNPNDTIVLVVSGDIIIETSVNRIDGIYIAGGSFFDADGTSGNIGQTLVINGAVYAQALSLPRVLATGNNTTPADQIIFQPKYLVVLANSTLLGSPAVSWKEVAP